MSARSGDTGSLDSLLRRHQARLSALCRRLTGDPSDGADATQETMVRIVRSLARFDGRATFVTWSHRVAVNVCLDELRRRRRRGVTVAFDESTAGPAPDGMAPVGRGSDVDGDPSGGIAAHLDVDRALRALPPEFRIPVVLRDLAGLSYAEIADELGVPIGTVRSRIARGRAALAPALADPDEGRAPRPALRAVDGSGVER